MKQKIITSLVYRENAEEAVEFYLSIFGDGRVVSTTYFPENAPGGARAGSVCAVHFEMLGQSFVAVNGGGHFSFTEAMSLYVNCDTQTEIDELWEKLSAGGATNVCGWLKDKYGVSWQIVPSLIEDVMDEGDQEKIQRVYQVVWQSEKLNIAELEAAAKGQ